MKVIEATWRRSGMALERRFRVFRAEGAREAQGGPELWEARCNSPQASAAREFCGLAHLAAGANLGEYFDKSHKSSR